MHPCIRYSILFNVYFIISSINTKYEEDYWTTWPVLILNLIPGFFDYRTTTGGNLYVTTVLFNITDLRARLYCKVCAFAGLNERMKLSILLIHTSSFTLTCNEFNKKKSCFY